MAAPAPVPWPESWRGRDGESLLGSLGSLGGATKRGGIRGSPQLQHSADETSYPRHPSLSTPMSGQSMPRGSVGGGGCVGVVEGPAPWKMGAGGDGYKRAMLQQPASGGGDSSTEQYKEAGSLPSTLARPPLTPQGGGGAGGYGRGGASSPSPFEGIEAGGIDAPLLFPGGARDSLWQQSRTPSSPDGKAAMAAMAQQNPPPSWDLGFGGQNGVEGARTSRQGGGGGGGLGAGDRSCAPPGAHAASEGGRALYYDDRALRGPPLPDQPNHHAHLSQSRSHQQQSHLPQQLQSECPPLAGTTVSPRGMGRRVRDPGSYGTGGVRSLFPGEANSLLPPSPSAGFAALDAIIVGGQAAGGGRKKFAFGEQRSDPGRYGGVASGGNGVSGVTALEGRAPKRMCGSLCTC